MDTNQRVIDYVKDIAEYVQTRDGRISASQMLERFLFTPDMQYTPISKQQEIGLFAGLTKIYSCFLEAFVVP